MNKKVLVLSRHNFIKFIGTLTSKQVSEIAFISIRDFGHDEILTDSDNVLNLQFDDGETQESWVTQLFNDEMAKQLKMVNLLRLNLLDIIM